MPAVLFKVRWPDGGIDDCYSPSTVIRDYFEIGRAYPLAEFVETSGVALRAASERVRRRYGGAGCGRAMAQLAAIEATASRQTDRSKPVLVESFQNLGQELAAS